LDAGLHNTEPHHHPNTIATQIPQIPNVLRSRHRFS
jgi:hypothetical protein